MPTDVVRYPRYRLPAAIISHAVWLDYRFALSFRDVEDLLALRGITASYESIRRWCETFGAAYARRLRHRAGPLRPHLASRRTVRDDPRPAPYLWRAVDQDGEAIDVLLQPRRDRRAAARFLRRLLKWCGRVPHRLVTDRLGSYRAAPSTAPNASRRVAAIRAAIDADNPHLLRIIPKSKPNHAVAAFGSRLWNGRHTSPWTGPSACAHFLQLVGDRLRSAADAHETQHA
jgi:putative transposase